MTEAAVVDAGAAIKWVVQEPGGSLSGRRLGALVPLAARSGTRQAKGLCQEAREGG